MSFWLRGGYADTSGCNLDELTVKLDISVYRRIYWRLLGLHPLGHISYVPRVYGCQMGVTGGESTGGGGHIIERAPGPSCDSWDSRFSSESSSRAVSNWVRFSSGPSASAGWPCTQKKAPPGIPAGLLT
eukprot:6651146-Pyramimonas_sp.AAC.1